MPTSIDKGTNLCKYRKMAGSRSVLGKGIEAVRVSTNCPRSTEKGSNLCEYRKMASSGSVPGKGGIRASVEKLSRGVPEKCRICVSTEKWQNRAQYHEKVESVRVSKNCPEE